MGSSALNVFGTDYASIYDQTYADKDYTGEVDMLVRSATKHGLQRGGRVLDVGCGTGRHADLLAQRGYNVTGTDISRSMLAYAEERAQGRFQLRHRDEMDKESREFDMVYSLFDVLSYQTTTEDAATFLAELRSWTRPGGLVIVDAWHLAGLIADPPSPRSRKIALTDGRTLSRSSIATVDWIEGTTEVRYHLELQEGTTVRAVDETHRMRAFSKFDLELLATQTGLSVLSIAASPSLDGVLQPEDWHIAMIARAN